MRIHIVNYEIGLKDGILTKYATQMESKLKELGYEVDVSNQPDPSADINHHINYLAYKECPETLNTLMVTHFTEDPVGKLAFVKKAMETADYGICFSEDVERFLRENGIENTSTVLPATEIVRRPRRIAIMTEIYPDGRKREWMYKKLFETIDKDKFFFEIVGCDKWKPLLDVPGLKYEWHETYTPELGQIILDNADYLLYVGNENCQAQSVVDAKKAGVRVICTDRECFDPIEIDYKFETQEELNAIFKKLETSPVDGLTWDNYVKNHIKIWKKLYENKFGK